MAELIGSPNPSDQFGGVTTEMPRSRVSPGAIESSYNAEARGLEALAAGAMDVATTFAEREAAEGLQNEKVTIGPDGKLQVLNRPQSIIFGQAGEAFAKTVAAGTVARVDTVVQQQLNGIAVKYIGDPAGQQAATTAFLTNLKGATGSPMVDEVIQRRAAGLAQGHIDHNLEQTARLQHDNDIATLQATKQDAIERMATLAQGGVTLDTPGEAGDRMRSEWGRYEGAQNTLSSDPRTKYPQELRELDDGHVRSRLTATTLMGQIDRFMTGQDPGGMAAAKKVVATIEQMQGIDRQEKRILLQDAQSRISANYMDWQARQSQNRQENERWIAGMQTGQLGRDSFPLITQAIQRTKALGDAEEAARLQSIFDARKAQAPLDGLPQTQRQEILSGAPAAGPVNVIQKFVGGEYGKTATANQKPFNGIVLHVTGKPDLKSQLDYMSKPDPNRPGQYGYHFLIDRDGKVYQTAPFDVRTNHVLPSGDKGVSNENTLGISLVGGDKGATPEQIAAGKQLVGQLQQQFRINGDRVFGHGEIDASRSEGHGLGPGNAAEAADFVKAIRSGGGDTVQPAAFTPGAMPNDAQPAGQYQAPINEAAKKHGLDPILLTRQLYQENQFRPTGTSRAGAQGIAQFMPGTAARYGVNVNDPQSSIDGAARYMSDLVKRYKGNVGLALAGYNWGEGNVDHWLQVGNRPVPKETRDYVLKITGHSIDEWRSDPKLSLPTDYGQARTGVGSERLPPLHITPDMVARDPRLAGSYLNEMLTSPQDTYASSRTIMDAITKRVEMGGDIPPQAAAQILQGVQANPTDERWAKLGSELTAATTVAYAADGPGAPAAKQAEWSEQARTNPDIRIGEVYRQMLDMEQKRQKHRDENPFDVAAPAQSVAPPQAAPSARIASGGGGAVLSRPVLPIDPQRPESLLPALNDRIDAAKIINQRTGVPEPSPLVQKGDKAAFEQIMSGPYAAPAIASLSQLPPENLAKLTDDKEFVNTLTGLARSGDPAKSNASFGLMDTMEKQDSRGFEAKFSRETMADLEGWRWNLRFAGEDYAKVAKEMFSPATSQRRAVAAEITHEAMKVETWQSISNRLAGKWFGNEPMAQTPDVGLMQGEMLSAWRKNFELGYIKTGTPDGAKTFADKATANVFSPSAANGGAVMKYAPEAWYKNQDGSPDPITQNGEMQKQLEGWVQKTMGFDPNKNYNPFLAFGTSIAGPNASEQEAKAYQLGRNPILWSDDKTEQDVLARRDPSYKVIVRDENGGVVVLPGRIQFNRETPAPERRDMGIRENPVIQ